MSAPDHSGESPTEVRARLQREIEYLADQVDKIEKQMPSQREIDHWREMALADERASWARKKIAVLVPVGVAVVVSVWQLIEWLREHISFK